MQRRLYRKELQMAASACHRSS